MALASGLGVEDLGFGRLRSLICLGLGMIMVGAFSPHQSCHLGDQTSVLQFGEADVTGTLSLLLWSVCVDPPV